MLHLKTPRILFPFKVSQLHKFSSQSVSFVATKLSKTRTEQIGHWVEEFCGPMWSIHATTADPAPASLLSWPGKGVLCRLSSTLASNDRKLCRLGEVGVIAAFRHTCCGFSSRAVVDCGVETLLKLQGHLRGCCWLDWSQPNCKLREESVTPPCHVIVIAGIVQSSSCHSSHPLVDSLTEIDTFICPFSLLCGKNCLAVCHAEALPKFQLKPCNCCMCHVGTLLAVDVHSVLVSKS